MKHKFFMKLSLKQLLLVETYRENASISSSIDGKRRSYTDIAPILRNRKKHLFWHLASHESDQNIFPIMLIS